MTSVIYRHFMPFLVGFGVVTTVAGIQETPMAEYSMPQRRKRRKPNVKKHVLGLMVSGSQNLLWLVVSNIVYFPQYMG
jgi:hypothetical protein